MSVVSFADGRTYRQALTVAILFVTFVLVTSGPWLREPRFYAEEAQLFISNLHDGGLWDALTFLHRRGYYQLPINLSAFLATRFDIAVWPAVTQGIALVVQTFVVLSPFVFMSVSHPARSSRLALALGFAFVLPNAEIWLTTTGLHFLLAIPVLLVVTDSCRIATTRRANWTTVYLALACLSGPPACLFAPAFGLRWMLCRSRVALVQAVVVTALAALQVLLMRFGELPGSIAAPGTLLEQLGLGVPAVWLGQSVVLPLAGFSGFDAVGSIIVGYPGIAAALVVALWGAAWLVVRRDADRRRSVVFLAMFVVTYLSVVLAQQEVVPSTLLQEPITGERYTVVTSHATVLLLFLVLSRWASGARGRGVQVVCLLAIVVAGGWYGFTGRKQFPGPGWGTELGAERDGARPCGLIVPGPVPWIIQLDRERLRREIASRLVAVGYLDPADSDDPSAMTRAIRLYKEQVLHRPARSLEIGAGMIERLCGYAALLAPYRKQ